MGGFTSSKKLLGWMSSFFVLIEGMLKKTGIVLYLEGGETTKLLSKTTREEFASWNKT